MLKYSAVPLENKIAVKDYVRDYVDVPRFLECCRACHNYSSKWSCPPYDFDPLSLWGKYGEFWIFGTKLELAPEFAGSDYNAPETNREIRAALSAEKRKLMERALGLEKEHPGSLGLSAGSCDLCAECAKKSGSPCRSPELMRYSIEALGGNVGETAEKLLATPIKWVTEGKTPEYFVLVCGLLTK